MIKKNLVSFIILLLFGFLFLPSACTKEKTASNKKQTELKTNPLDNFTDSLVIELKGKDSSTVFDLLKANHKVKYLSSALGVFVTAIDSLKITPRLFWVYSVNDSMAKIACDKYITKTGDKIKWHYRYLKK
ncbi:MAG: DUF4430 domain-containing protein [FCB group bacterium]|nr:DUF4430 domain-containing protein [FCB group bacterium]